MDEICISFGKHKGTPISEVPANYLLWMRDGDVRPGSEERMWIEDNLQHLQDLKATGLGDQ